MTTDADIARAAVFEVWNETYLRPSLPADCDVSPQYRAAFEAAAAQCPDAGESAGRLSLQQRGLLIRAMQCHEISGPIGTVIDGLKQAEMAMRMRDDGLLTEFRDGRSSSGQRWADGIRVYVTPFGHAVGQIARGRATGEFEPAT